MRWILQIAAVFLFCGGVAVHAQCSPFTDAFSGSGALSSNWVNAPGMGSATVVQASGVAQSGAAATTGGALVNTAICTFSADQSDGYTLTTTSGGKSCLLLRMTTGGNGYCFYLDPSFAGILTLVAGAGTPIGTGGTCPAVAGGVYTFSVVGVILTASYNGVPCETVSDGTYATGQPGIALVPTAAANGVQVSSYFARNDSFAITAGTCTGGALSVTQLTAFSGCTLSSSGASGAVTWSVITTLNYNDFQTLPDGMAINASTGAITSARINGQGIYNTFLAAEDAVGDFGAVLTVWSAAGNNTFGGISLNAPGSVFSARVDGLPIDTTSPFHTIFPPYSSRTLQALFGPNVTDAGIPINTVPSTQSFVSVNAGTTNLSSGPWDMSLAVEGGWNSITACPSGPGNCGDHHMAIFIEAGSSPAAVYESYQLFPNGDGTWGGGTIGSQGGAADAFAPGTPPNIAGFGMPTQDDGTTVAAGTPLAGGLVNYDEVAGICGVGSECGAVKHAVNFTLPLTINNYVWPGTARAGSGGANPCSGGYEDDNGLIAQSPSVGPGGPPTLCQSLSSGSENPMGQTFILPLSVSEPSQCSSNPVTHILFTGFQRYGIRLTDNGSQIGIEGTPDSRWPAVATMNACLAQLPLGEWVSPMVDSLALSWPNSSQTNMVPVSTFSGGVQIRGGVVIQ
jgi:hypothetical protein